MKWFKRFIVACVLLIFCIKPGDSQERTHEYDWVGVWSYKLDFFEDSIRLKAIVRYKDGVEEKVLYDDSGL